MEKKMRLINANARIEEIKKAYCSNCDNYNGVRCRACWVDDAIGLIDDAPTVEAEPVVHGYWKQNPNMPTQYSCSVCRRQIDDMMCNPNKYFPYCHCGAKMDSETEDGQSDCPR